MAYSRNEFKISVLFSEKFEMKKNNFIVTVHEENNQHH